MIWLPDIPIWLVSKLISEPTRNFEHHWNHSLINDLNFHDKTMNFINSPKPEQLLDNFIQSITQHGLILIIKECYCFLYTLKAYNENKIAENFESVEHEFAIFNTIRRKICENEISLNIPEDQRIFKRELTIDSHFKFVQPFINIIELEYNKLFSGYVEFSQQLIDEIISFHELVNSKLFNEYLKFIPSSKQQQTIKNLEKEKVYHRMDKSEMEFELTDYKNDCCF